jgi:uncharacterized protein (DUF1330 family)
VHEQAARRQEEEIMAVYMVFNEQVTDQAKFDTYRQQAGPLISRYGGRFLVRGGNVTTLEGNPSCLPSFRIDDI